MTMEDGKRTTTLDIINCFVLWITWSPRVWRHPYVTFAQKGDGVQNTLYLLTNSTYLQPVGRGVKAKSLNYVDVTHGSLLFFVEMGQQQDK